MSALAEAAANIAAEVASHVPLRTIGRIARAGVRLLAYVFYVLGRSLLKLVRAPRSETGVPEAIVGFLIVAGLVTALVKLPFRLLAAVMR
ncbi:MAG: hypothetical protein KDJ47_16610 [Hyphomicrobiaceae bacterium]|nr:hypothetical protein [Hyphomicrobiaceae bacterium]